MPVLGPRRRSSQRRAVQSSSSSCAALVVNGGDLQRYGFDMERDDQPTCGKGLAANADLPAKLAGLLAARADVLEQHMKALDLTDPASRQERDAYDSLAGTHREIAAELDRMAQQMAGYRSL